MATSVYTSLLIKDYKRKAGNIKALRKELREMAKVVLEEERELSALLTVIQSREPDFNPSSVKTIATVPKVLGLKWNQLTILILDALRISEKTEVHIQAITDHVIHHGGIEIENRRARAVVYRSVKSTLRRMANKGRIVHCYNNSTETAGLWSLPSSGE